MGFIVVLVFIRIDICHTVDDKRWKERNRINQHLQWHRKEWVIGRERRSTTCTSIASIKEEEEAWFVLLSSRHAETKYDFFFFFFRWALHKMSQSFSNPPWNIKQMGALLKFISLLLYMEANGKQKENELESFYQNGEVSACCSYCYQVQTWSKGKKRGMNRMNEWLNEGINQISVMAWKGGGYGYISLFAGHWEGC